MKATLAALLLLATPASLSAAGLFEGAAPRSAERLETGSWPSGLAELDAAALGSDWSSGLEPSGTARRFLDRSWTRPLELDVDSPAAERRSSGLALRSAFDPHFEVTSSYSADPGGGSAGNAGAPGAAPAAGGSARRLPFLGQKARDAGYELPLPFGTGPVYYHLSRDIEISEVRVGRNGAPLQTVGDFVQFGSHAKVDNLNAKFDVWLLPFLNLYAIAGYVWNEADTSIEVTLPPLVPTGEPRRRRIELPTKVEGTVAGLGVTLAGGYKKFFFAFDVNRALADIGFDEEFKATVSSLRVGWNGMLGSRAFRTWLSGTYWDTFAVASGTVADPDGGTLHFEVGQGPEFPYTYGVGAQYSVKPSFDLAGDVGIDFHGGWYIALVPVFRF